MPGRLSTKSDARQPARHVDVPNAHLQALLRCRACYIDASSIVTVHTTALLPEAWAAGVLNLVQRQEDVMVVQTCVCVCVRAAPNLGAQRFRRFFAPVSGSSWDSLTLVRAGEMLRGCHRVTRPWIDHHDWSWAHGRSICLSESLASFICHPQDDSKYVAAGSALKRRGVLRAAEHGVPGHQGCIQDCR